MDAKPIKNLRIISEKDMKLTQKNCEIKRVSRRGVIPT
jgi:hypothetical protein